jgi:hypothetical protein
MAIDRIWRGTGMTRRQLSVLKMRVLDAPAELAELASVQDFDELFPGGQPSFDAMVADIEAAARAFLGRAPREGVDRGRAEEETDFAQHILKLIKVVRAAIGEDRADEAARFGLRLGQLSAELQMKLKHEPIWAAGAKQRHDFRQGREVGNSERRLRREIEWRAWNQTAAEVWADRPHLSVSAVAREVRRKLGLPDAVKTIARRLRRP